MPKGHVPIHLSLRVMLAGKQRFLVMGAIALALSFFIYASLNEEDKLREEFETHYRIYSLPMPSTLEFAGEPVPLGDLDVKERFDRELLTNVYWQSQTLMLLKRAHRYFPLIVPILKKHGLPDDFKYLAVAESGLQHVVSPAGATGFWQLLEKTAKSYGLEVTEEVDERYHIEKSTEAACRYLTEARSYFSGWTTAAASYNMGIDGIRRVAEQQRTQHYYDLYLNTETSRYILRAAAIKEIMEHPEKYGFHILPGHLYEDVPLVRVKVDRSIGDLAAWAIGNGCNYKALKLCNPWLRKNTLTVKEGKAYYIGLPKAMIAKTALQARVVNDTLVIPQDSVSTPAR